MSEWPNKLMTVGSTVSFRWNSLIKNREENNKVTKKSTDRDTSTESSWCSWGNLCEYWQDPDKQAVFSADVWTLTDKTDSQPLLIQASRLDQCQRVVVYARENLHRSGSWIFSTPVIPVSGHLCTIHKHVRLCSYQDVCNSSWKEYTNLVRAPSGSCQ